MKKLASLALLALELAVCGCGSSAPSTTTSTTTSGNWEAQLTNGTGPASLLDFVVSFSVTNSGPLTITGFSFINSGACFATGPNAETETGSATLTTSSTSSVTGTLNLTVNSVMPSGNVLTLNGNLTGTPSGTTTTPGNLTNGVVVGTWTLTGPCATSGIHATGDFVMCQDAATCTLP